LRHPLHPQPELLARLPARRRHVREAPEPLAHARRRPRAHVPLRVVRARALQRAVRGRGRRLQPVALRGARPSARRHDPRAADPGAPAVPLPDADQPADGRLPAVLGAGRRFRRRPRATAARRRVLQRVGVPPRLPARQRRGERPLRRPCHPRRRAGGRGGVAARHPPDRRADAPERGRLSPGAIGAEWARRVSLTGATLSSEVRSHHALVGPEPGKGALSIVMVEGPGERAPHRAQNANMHLTLMLRAGLVGWALMMWVIGAALAAIYQGSRRVQDERLALVLWAIFSSGLGFLVSMANFNAFYNPPVQILFWGLLGIGMAIVTHLNGRRPTFNVIYRFGPGE